jgi:hypothetical protein
MVIITVMIIVILSIAIFVELQINSKPNAHLEVSGTNLRVSYYGPNRYLMIDAKIINTGKANATNIILFVQTYYKNGTESANWNMILWQNTTVPAIYSEIHPTNVTISAGQSYLVQSGNYVMTEDIEHPLFPYGYPTLYSQLYDTDFFASNKITLYYQTA